MRLLVWTLIQYDRSPYKREKFRDINHRNKAI